MSAVADRLPRLLYGTAWKGAETERLVLLALKSGFRGIDTANQRKHYNEAGVGAAIKRAIAGRVVTRDALFVQTKFTPVAAQDHRQPYDLDADPGVQVQQSFASSLDHLGLDRIDSYLLHGPSTGSGLRAYDLAVWRAMEGLAARGQTGALGISNVTLAQLKLLWSKSQTKPAFVQNRCCASTGWDRAVRAFCTKHGIVYQAFSLMNANQLALETPTVDKLAGDLGCSRAQLVYRFAQQRGMLPLTGTTNRLHMREDLAAETIWLDPKQLAAMDRIGR